MASDAAIIQRCQNGELNQLEVLVDAYGRRLYGLCCKLTETVPDADDLYQDTWVRVMDNIHRFDIRHRFLPWLFTICLNRYRDKYRQRKRWKKRLISANGGPGETGPLQRAMDSRPGADQQLAATEELKRLRYAVTRLDDTIRIPLLLYYYRDFGLAEIAIMIGVPEGTIKSRLARARKLLKELMEDDHA
ncbi:MAG: sigma-70 family RNA polymerase sigma factor [Holophagae bacterium]|nr:sigma-70 family RNA polymerase sigma factor [Holophagae bacterium]